MLLSSCVIWRHRDFADFRAECPGGDEELQRDLRSTRRRSRLARVARRARREPDTGNPRTVGRRFDPRSLTDTLVRSIGDNRVRLSFQAVPANRE